MSNNKQVRSDIMSILDDNSKNIPEGVYLKLCNKLQQFKFDDDDDDIKAARLEDLRRRQEMGLPSPAEEIRREAARQSKYVTNPETGRKVLRNGRIGRALAREQ